MPRQKAGTVVEEYLVRITPYFNSKQYKKIMEDFEEKIYKRFKKIDKSVADKDSKTKSLAKNMDSASKSGVKVSNLLNVAPAKLGIIIASITAIYSIMKKIVNEATSFSNKMISASSAFVNKDTRNIMAKFGVGSQSAAGLQSVMSLMNISEEDLKLMTPGQMSLFSNLMKQWNEGINSIDKSKLDYYNEVIQEMQSDIAIEKLRIQIEIYKMFVDLAPQIKSAGDSTILLIRSFATLMTSPLVKTAISSISSFLEVLAKIASFISYIGGMQFLKSSLSDYVNGASGSSTSYSYNITVDATSSNQFSGSNNTMFDLATNVSKQNSQIIEQTLIKTGRV